ncbi:two-component system QseEF-associated lipoprotein QseG [Enterobacteriaceae bacterium 4M9]|nr:two-component system QseEF-associated lipoprotein QseG [Enterobacteriaceae bacterium 4M9]
MKKTMTRAAWCAVIKSARRFLLPSALLLAGCVKSEHVNVPQVKPEVVAPEQQLADYRNVDCDALWQMKGQATEENPLYWLRGMDCAQRLAPADARMLAHHWNEETWQAAFRQSIVLAKARITPQERRLYVMRLDNVSYAIPDSLRPLYQLWRESQVNELELVRARGRYSTLQENTDQELDGLRQQEKHLRAQLEQTTRQLQNLTDIERQLSSRKSSGSYLPTEKNGPADENDELASPGDKKAQDAEQPPEGTKP